jgi:hypothetical protein
MEAQPPATEALGPGKKITAVTGGGSKTGTFSVFVITPAGTSAGNAGADFTYK